MATNDKSMITTEVTINSPVEKVWKLFTDPIHIIHWNNASDDWCTTMAENDLRVGGRFLSRMEAKDGNAGFDFSGKYNKVENHKLLEYTLDDGRNVQATFSSKGNETVVKVVFEAENENSVEDQRSGWQAILDNFKKYAEASDRMESLHFEITINAKAEKVYNTLIDKNHYSEWTSAFNPTSHYIGSWEKGSKILFLGTDQNGNEGGMASKIRENIPNKFVSIEHLSIIQNGKELEADADVENWAGALENYSFVEKNDTTLFVVDADSKEQYKTYFFETWPKALNRLKAICEQ